MGYRNVNGEMVWVDDGAPIAPAVQIPQVPPPQSTQAPEQTAPAAAPRLELGNMAILPQAARSLGIPQLSVQGNPATPIDQGSLLQSRERSQAQVLREMAAENATQTAVNAMSERDRARAGAVGVQAQQQPGGGLGRVIGYSGGTPAHFEQAGNYYRGTPEQKQAIMGVLGANADRIQAQGELTAAELQSIERANSAADIEALKARKANQAQAVIDEMEAVDRDHAHQAVREAVDKHAALAAPDPAKYWGGLGFAGSVGMILADSLERMGSRMQGVAPANLIERGIERSLQQQQSAIDKAKGDITQAQGLYAQMRQSGMDKEHAFQAAKARRMEDAAGIIDSYQRQARVPQVRAQLAMQAADLRERAGSSFLQLSESIAGQGKGRQVAATGGAPIYAGGDLKQRMALAAARKAEAEATQAERKASGQEDRPLSDVEVKVKDKVAEIDRTIDGLAKLRKTIPSASQASLQQTPVVGGWLVGRDAQSWQNKARPIVAKALNEISGASYNPSEYATAWNDFFGNVSDPKAVREAIDGKLEELRAKRAQAAAPLSARGVGEYEGRVGTEKSRLNLQGR